MHNSDHVAVVEQIVGDQTQRNERYFSWFTEDVVFLYPVAGTQHPHRVDGKAAMRAFAAGVADTLPTLEVRDLKVELLADGSSVLAEFEYYTAPDKSPAYRSRYCTIARFEGDLVRQYSMYFDATALPKEDK